MLLNKSIYYGKEHRKTYSKRGRRSASVDRSCRNHGTCNYCLRNRLYHHYKENLVVDDELRTMYDTSYHPDWWYDKISEQDELDNVSYSWYINWLKNKND